MARPTPDSTVFTIRVPAALEQRLTGEARRRRLTRSEVVRAALDAGLRREAPGFAAEARRQSLLVSRHPGERDTLDFLLHVADTTGWK